MLAALAKRKMIPDWETQIAWRTWAQASIMSHVAWPLPQYEAEYADYVEQEDDFRKIDIASELLRLSCEGIQEMEKATLVADCLRLQLATVKYILDYVSDTAYLLPAGDDLELLAARALRQIDEVLRRQAEQEAPPLPAVAVKRLKLLQRHSQDIAVLACSRFICQTILRSQGISPELLTHLEAAFWKAALQDEDLWSRIGNSKFHVFTEGMKFGTRLYCRGRKSRRIQEADATFAAEPMFIASRDLPQEDLTDGTAAADEPMMVRSLSTRPSKILPLREARNMPLREARELPLREARILPLSEARVLPFEP